MKPKDIKSKVVVLTGKFNDIKRAEAEAALARLGATISGSISKNTDILFAGERAGSKLAKAESLGVKVSDEATLSALLAAAPPPADDTSSENIEETPVEGLAGKVVALTGKFMTMKRADAQKLLREAGATVGSGVTKATDVLIYGDNAGSKLDKAASAGVSLMTELEMVALLTVGGAGNDRLAGAEALLAEKQTRDAASATEMTKVVAELRAFVQGLKRRKDIRVEHATLGRKAGKAKLAQLVAQGMPAEFVEFHAEMDGIRVEWRFVEPPGGGCIRMSPVTQWSRFTDDDSHYMNFGDDREAMLLDEITPEGNTWLVRPKSKQAGEGAGDCTIMFASAAEGADGVVAASSLAEYLREAMRNGFGFYWPRCFKVNEYVSYAAEEMAIGRFQAIPVIPTAIRVGQRVQFEYFSEGGRGEVLVIHDAPDTKLAQVKLDEGTIAWIPQTSMKTWATLDAYERLRDPSFDFAAAIKADVSALLDDIARAIDPLAGHMLYPFAKLPSNGRRAAGLLSTRTFAEAVRVVVDLQAAITRAKLDCNESRGLVETGDEFAPAELSRLGSQYMISGILGGLFGGLTLLALHESARRGVAGTELLDAKLLARLAKIADAAELRERCASTTPLTAPSWSTSSEDWAASLDLPADALVFLGSGA